MLESEPIVLQGEKGENLTWRRWFILKELQGFTKLYEEKCVVYVWKLILRRGKK